MPLFFENYPNLHIGPIAREIPAPSSWFKVITVERLMPENLIFLTLLNGPSTTRAEIANTVDPDETAHNDEPSHQDLQCLPSDLWSFNIHVIQIELKVFFKFCRQYMYLFFLALWWLMVYTVPHPNSPPGHLAPSTELSPPPRCLQIKI